MPLSRPTLTLIAITDNLRDGVTGLTARAVAAARGGATMIQLRLKQEDARTLFAAAQALRTVLPVDVPLIVNDRADIALAAHADGVHVGADDVPVAMVRRIAPPGFIIGTSVGNESEVANAALADYVGIGPVYPTPSKADAGEAIGVTGFTTLAARMTCPVVAIGGITVANLSELTQTPAATGVAVISAIFGTADPESAARAIRTQFHRQTTVS